MSISFSDYFWGKITSKKLVGKRYRYGIKFHDGDVLANPVTSEGIMRIDEAFKLINCGIEYEMPMRDFMEEYFQMEVMTPVEMQENACGVCSQCDTRSSCGTCSSCILNRGCCFRKVRKSKSYEIAFPVSNHLTGCDFCLPHLVNAIRCVTTLLPPERRSNWKAVCPKAGYTILMK